MDVRGKIIRPLADTLFRADFDSLEGWREHVIRILILVAVIVLPFAYFFSMPIHMAEKRYLLMSFYLAMLAFFVAALFYRKSMRTIYAVTIAFLYVITFSNFLFLGPHYARATWLVLTAIIASILFGARGAVVSTFLNAVMLVVLHSVIQPTGNVWTGVYASPGSLWTEFVVNVTLITLACSLSVSILLNRLDRTLRHERHLRMSLLEEKEKMTSLNEALSREITEREFNEQALLASRSRYLTLFESSADAIFIMEDGIITECNRKAEETFGQTRDAIIGRTPWDLSPVLQPDGRPSRERPWTSSAVSHGSTRYPASSGCTIIRNGGPFPPRSA